MPGPYIPDPTPSWLKPENASVTDSSLTKALRMIGSLIGADNPTAQVFGLMMTDVPGGSATGGLAKAVEGLKARVIKAYHGSPHDFDQFSSKFINTGEKAQAYGHGLYFAEHEPVAQQYKKDLGLKVKSFSGEPVKTPAEDMAHDILSRIPRSANQDANLQRAIQTVDEWGDAGVFRGPNEGRKMLEIKQAIADNFHKKLDSTIQGKMYEVAIHADPEDFLDWDKPLSQQSEKVKAKLSDLGFREGRARDPHGETIYDQLKAPRTTAGNSPAATENLKQAGIPGIKYLDQGSRGWQLVKHEGKLLRGFSSEAEAQSALGKLPQSAEPRRVTKMPYDQEWAIEGQQGTTRNYVVFDDRLIDILKKYGLLLPAAGAATQGQTLISSRGEQ